MVPPMERAPTRSAVRPVPRRAGSRVGRPSPSSAARTPPLRLRAPPWGLFCRRRDGPSGSLRRIARNQLLPDSNSQNWWHGFLTPLLSSDGALAVSAPALGSATFRWWAALRTAPSARLMPLPTGTSFARCLLLSVCNNCPPARPSSTLPSLGILGVLFLVTHKFVM